MIIGNLLGSFRRLCFYFSTLAPLYVLNASNSAVADHVGKLYRSVHVKNTEESPSLHLDEEEPENLSAFNSHSWPTAWKFENGKWVQVEAGNRMLFNDQIVESGNVFNHMDKYHETESIFKLENRYSILNVLLGDDLAKFYINVYNGEVSNYSSDTLNELSELYCEKLITLDGPQVINSIFCKDKRIFLNVCKCICSKSTEAIDIVQRKRFVPKILSDLDFILLSLKDMYNEKMHGIYKDLVYIKNSTNKDKKKDPLQIWTGTSGEGEDSSTHTRSFGYLQNIIRN